MKKNLCNLLVLIMVLMTVGPMNFANAAPNDVTDIVVADPGNNWPSVFMPYVDSSGNAIYDPGDDEHPIDVDITSGVDKGIGNLPSVYFATDGTNAFFRLRLKGDPYDRKGGFLSSVWLVQLAVGGVHKATVGLDGKSTTNDYVYVANPDGTNVRSIYRTGGTGKAVTGTRIVAAENGHYFLDFQVPINQITQIDNSINGTTDVELFYGTSKAANLSVINKEWMSGSAVSFNGLGTVRLGTQPLSVSIDGGASKTYAYGDRMTGKFQLGSGSVHLKITNAGATTTYVDTDAASADVSNGSSNNTVWSYALPVSITGTNGTYKATATVTENGITKTALQDIVISGNIDATTSEGITIDGGTTVYTTSSSHTFTGTYKSINGASAKVYISLNGGTTFTQVTNTSYDNHADLGDWSYTLPTLLSSSGTYNIVARTQTGGGTVLATATQQLIYDSNIAIGNPTIAINPVNGSSAQPAISGTCTNADKVEVKIDGVTVAFATPASGQWSIPALEKPLTAADYVITAIATNTSGGSAQTTANYTISDLSITIDNGSSVILNDNQPTLRGNTNATGTVTVNVDGHIYTPTVSNGRWVVEIPADDQLADGTYTVTAATNAGSGNVSATQQLTIDTATTIAITAPRNTATISQANPDIAGTAEANATIDLRLSTSGGSSIFVRSLTADSSGNWTTTAPILANDTYNVYARASDVYGNIAETNSIFTVIAAAAQVATPTANPTGSQVASGSTVELSCATTGATVYYTTDGTIPNAGSTPYNSTPIPVTGAVTIKAIAVMTGMADSAVMSESYTVQGATYDIGVSQTSTLVFTAKTAGYTGTDARTITITNTGTGSITNLSVRLSGEDKDSFVLGSLGSTSLSAGDSTTFTVDRDENLAADTYTGTVTVTATPETGADITKTFDVSFTVNDAPTYNINVSQTGTLVFTGKQTGYAGSDARTITVSNIGTGNITDLSVALSGENPGSFALGALGGNSLAAGASTTFTVDRNTALTAGTYTGIVSITAVAGAGGTITRSFNVSFAVDPADVPTYGIRLSQTVPLELASQVAGYTPAAETITVFKSGTGDIQNLQLSIDGADKTSFATANLSRASLDGSNSNATFQIKPVSGLPAGTYTATVVVTATPAGGGTSFEKSFDVGITVTTAAMTDSQEVDDTLKRLKVDFSEEYDTWESVTSNIYLIREDNNAATVTWTSSNSAVVDVGAGAGSILTASVHRQATETSVILTASVTKNGITKTRTFLLIIKASSLSKTVDSTVTRSVDAGLAQQDVIRINVTNGATVQGTIDKIILSNAAADAISAAASSNTAVVSLAENPANKADEYAVEIPRTALAEISSNSDMALSINNDYAQLHIPSEQLQSMQGNNSDMYVRIVPIKDTAEKQQVYSVVASDGLIANEIQHNKTVTPLGNPLTVEANYSVTEIVNPNIYRTELVIPFEDNGITLPGTGIDSFLNSLAVFVRHSGSGISPELLKVSDSGARIIYKSGQPFGIAIDLSNFSTFSVVKLDANTPPGGGGASTSGSLSAAETVKVDVETGSVTAGTVVSNEIITRTTLADGSKKDVITLNYDTMAETVRKLLDADQNVARLVLPDVNDGVSEITVNIPKRIADNLSANKIDFEIQTKHGRISIPYTSLEGLPADFYFRIVPIKAQDQRKQVENQAVTDQLVKALADGKNIVLVERPYTIETNMPSRPVTVTLPFKETAVPSLQSERDTYARDMYVYIQHTDGEKAVEKGAIVPYDNKIAYGFQFDISKFSVFAIVNMTAEITQYNIEGQSSPTVIDPLSGTVSVEMPSGYDLSKLVATFTLSQDSAATVNGVKQVSGVTANDFTTTVRYLVTGRNGAQKEWLVSVSAGKGFVEGKNSHKAYMVGYPDSEFKPERAILRSEMAAIIARLVTEKPVNTKAGISNYPDIEGNWALKSIQKTSLLGIMHGYPDNTFRPDGKITRAEMATLVVNWLGLTEKGEMTYKDVNKHWAENNIAIISKAGYMKGYPDGTFRPDAALTRAEAVTIINRVLKRGPLYGINKNLWPDVNIDHWAYNDIEEASQNHFFKENEPQGELIDNDAMEKFQSSSGHQ